MIGSLFILYGTQTGCSEELAKILYTNLKTEGYTCFLYSLDETIENETFTFIPDVNSLSTLIIFCSTTGNGDIPDNANKFWRKIKNRNISKNIFKQINYSVFSLGDTNYEKFCSAGKNIDRRINELGGNRIIKSIYSDEVTGHEENYDLYFTHIKEYLSINQ
jgi:sulfite reductase alpha subunit-like flavoprotein